MTPIKAPSMGESISEATVASWKKQVGDYVNADELIAELETEKINLEINAPCAGVLKAITTNKGATVKVGQVMGEIDETATAGAATSAPATAPSAPVVVAPVAAVAAPKMGPAVAKMVAETGVDAGAISGSGKGGRVTKEDVQAQLAKPMPAAAAPVVTAPVPPRATATLGTAETREPTSRLRKTIARRLKEAQNTAAILTTYNEVDMSAVMALRKKYKEPFQKEHGVGLGFMSFFTKAVLAGLKKYPAVNAEFTEDEIIYKHDYHVAVAVSSERGLVVPVVRHADRLSLAEIEKAITDLATKARDGKLLPEDLAGGTFTITNGGVFGSLMSMPILNMPQVGILGMHAIKERPVVVDGQIVIRPMMYLAFSYDHRIIDGREAVGFLVTVKEMIEDPSRLLVGV